MKFPDPDFPPLLSGTAVDAKVSPFVKSAQLANRGKCGAGDVIWSRSLQVAELAIVLEPDVPLVRAQQMAPVSMVAVGDALGVLCPPKVSVHFRWPGDILINGAKAGDIRMAAERCAPGDIPRWLVIGMRLQIVHGDMQKEPGEVLDRTCLVEEGIGADVTRSAIISSMSSYWMARLNNWLGEGLSGCHEKWMFGALGREEAVTINYMGKEYTGKVLGLDDEAGLLLKPEAGGPTQCLPYHLQICYLDNLETWTDQ